MDTTTTTTTKRLREVSNDDEESNFSNEYTDTKRVRRVSAEDYLFNILDDEDDYSAASQDIDDGDGLASVMHSLEQEIFSSTGSESEHTTGGCNIGPEVSVQELGYLLEASDDELGLPPAAEEEEEEEEAQMPSPAVLARDVAELAGADVAEPATMYGQIWGFDDEIGNGFGSDIGFGFRPESAGDDGFVGAVGFDDVGLFDHSEPSDLTWRTMPAA